MVLILLLTAFAGCGDAMGGNKETTPSVNAGQTPKEPDNKEEEQDDPTRVFTIGDLEPLSKEKQLEVEEAWNRRHNGSDALEWCETDSDTWIIWGDKYYGTFNECIVIFSPTGATSEETVSIAGKEITYGSGFALWVYVDGEFVDILTAYSNNIISDADVGEIARYHGEIMVYKYDKLR